VTPAYLFTRERLGATGDFTGAPSDSRLYDQALKTAVLAFQKRHQLGADAVVGPTTRAAMNVSALKRVNQIRINLERMRWVSDGLPGRLPVGEHPGGEALFQKDVYARDAAMFKALNKRSRLRIEHHRPVPPEAVTPAPPKEQKATAPPLRKPTITTLFDLSPLDSTLGEGPLDLH